MAKGHNEDKPRRVTIDMSGPAASEMDRISTITGQKTAEMFRSAFSLLRLYVQAIRDGKELLIVDEESGAQTKIELVFPNVVSASPKVKS